MPYKDVCSCSWHGDVMAGRQKAMMCQTCQGLDGKAKIPEAPSLAGQSATYLVKALNDY
jgi:cytochrome c553